MHKRISPEDKSRKPVGAERRVGVKHMAHACGLTQKQMRHWVRKRRGGAHDCWQLWLFTEDEGAALVKEWKEKHKPP
jgi:hypothetical protein